MRVRAEPGGVRRRRFRAIRRRGCDLRAFIFFTLSLRRYGYISRCVPFHHTDPVRSGVQCPLQVHEEEAG
ncbi:hypothetical protein KFK09_018721 [Dendrobium nobile]|uniref:Uncharacterized protein n=1 Tax=Dendrobium nobile TaxID=94219 RepID=A0A8T3AWJ8_DENNO|nr:hypothetical protein KFK09_018721 [Dendrobium nobile]